MSSKMKVRVRNPEQSFGSIELQLPMSDCEVVWAMGKIGIKDAIPYCRLSDVLDSDSAIKQMEGKVVNVDELNFLAKRMESLISYEQKKVAACCAARQVDNLKDMINITYSLDGLSVINDFSDLSVIGKIIYLDVNGAITETEEASIDFTKYTRDYMNRVQAAITIHGVLLPDNFPINQVYDGQVFPEYFYDENIVMSVAVKNRQGMEDYLYLPTDIHSVDKLKGRLNVEQFSECTIGRIQNMQLPDEIFQTVKGVKDIEELTLLNELCRTVKDFGKTEMSILEIVAEHTKADHISAVTGLAKQLNAFEVLPGICNAKDYGRYLVEDSGLYMVDESLLPHIDYEAFAKSEMSPVNFDSGFTDKGYVGTGGNVSEMLSYNGEFREPLESPAEETELLRLYSPLSCKLLYRDEEDDEQEELADWEVAKYEQEIRGALMKEIHVVEQERGLMHYFNKSHAVAGKVVSAFPTIEEYGGIFYGVLACRIREPLTQEELNILKDYWSGQASDGFGEGFEQRAIKTEDGELYVSFWNSGNNFFIKTEEELNGHMEMKQISHMEMQ